MAEFTPISRPLRVQQRAAGIAAVDRRVGLDDAAQHGGTVGFDGAVQGADDALGHGPLELAERVADDDGRLADVEVGRRACFQRLHAFGHWIHLEHRQVINGISADHTGGQARIAAEADLDLLGAVDHVEVGDDMPIGVPEETGAAAFLRCRAPKEVGAQHLGSHVDHGRRDALIDSDPPRLDVITARKAARGQWAGCGCATTITVWTRGVAVGVGVATMNRPGRVQPVRTAIDRSNAEGRKRYLMFSVRGGQ